MLLRLAAHAGGPKQNTPKPNVILIYADDLGYGDLECYGAKNIETPHGKPPCLRRNPVYERPRHCRNQHTVPLLPAHG